VPAGVEYLALLRGINVGGKNLIKMADLRAAFEAMGFTDVVTYIQSGNVFFRAPRQRRDELAAGIESKLSRRFGTELKVVLLTRAQLARVIDDAPKEFGGKSHRCDVLFVRKPLTVKRAFSVLEFRPDVDSAWPGSGVIYYARLASRASGSRLSNFVMLPEYQNVTIRSWSTTTKLLPKMDDEARGLS
jgi:uncharacterized protein (DUF1697 family)